MHILPTAVLIIYAEVARAISSQTAVCIGRMQSSQSEQSVFTSYNFKDTVYLLGIKKGLKNCLLKNAIKKRGFFCGSPFKCFLCVRLCVRCKILIPYTFPHALIHSPAEYKIAHRSVSTSTISN